MSQTQGDQVRGFFAAYSRNVTPAPLQHTVQVLYAPIARDPEFIRCCASVLSPEELSRAERFTRHADRSLFIQRRAFRRYCGALSLGSSEPLPEIVFQETDKGCPLLIGQSKSWFSFSSCRFGFLGGWSQSHAFGVDIADHTIDPSAAELAREYFSPAETRAVVGQRGRVNLRSFFHFWSLKEAALKSIGEGLPFGLDAFGFELEPSLRVVCAPSDYGGLSGFDAHIIEGTGSCAAIVLWHG